MDWLDKINNAIDYIESNLYNDISYERAAQIANCSNYQFQRMFSYITNVSLAEYIRRRRLTLAAFELQNSNIKIIDLALKFGYDSPISFSRAFQKLHGISPTSAREKGVFLKAYPKISFSLSIKGDEEMNYQIVQKGSFSIIGKPIKLKYGSNNDEFSIMYKMVENFYIENYTNITRDFSNNELYSVCNEYNGNTNEYKFYLGVKSDMEVPEGYEEIKIPEGTWAVFQAVGSLPASIERTRNRIYTEWFPTSGYTYRENEISEIERYLEGDNGSDKYVSEVWIPVNNKR